MAKEKEKIRVVAYVRVDGAMKDVDTLDDAQRRRLAGALKATYLQELFRSAGVEFRPKGEG